MPSDCEPLKGLRQAAYTALPERMYARIEPTPVREPHLVAINQELARELSLDIESVPRAAQAALLAGNVLPCGSVPIAAAYAGHQFGHFVPQLGDGRAILLGDAVAGTGQAFDVQLKGSGRTPYSRGGDGRAWIGPVLREYIVSEAMHALGIATTRSLAAVASGEAVLRERSLPGAVLTRVAASHVRVGTFQYFAARSDLEALKALADYSIERHFAHLRASPHPYLELLRAVCAAQAALIARWMQVGFIHGVMNTDNMAIGGETIDYGPCAFMDTFERDAVFSSIDQHGRYAFSNQPHAAVWNLARFAETLLPLIDTDTERAVARASEVIAEFSPRYSTLLLEGMRAKLGLYSAQAEDGALIESLLELMQRNQADFTLTFRRLCRLAEEQGGEEGMHSIFAHAHEFAPWQSAWRRRLDAEPIGAAERARRMRTVNPAYIPRNHRIEAMILAAAEREDFAPFAELHAVLQHPYEERAESARYAEPPQPAERVTQTFCGT